MNSLSHIKKFFVAAIFCLPFIYATQASAHRLNVYAWLDDDNVIVECNFGKNRPAQDSHVRVLDSYDSKVLVTGKTNNSGRFTFKVPNVVRDGHGLTIEVNAGQGHMGSWKMDAPELYSAAALTAGFDEANLERQRQEAGAAKRAYPRARSVLSPAESQPATVREQDPQMPQQNYDSAQTGAIIREAVEKGLAPIREELAAMRAQGPSIIEIIGGIGWIVGLAGIILYFRSRQKA